MEKNRLKKWEKTGRKTGPKWSKKWIKSCGKMDKKWVKIGQNSGRKSGLNLSKTLLLVQINEVQFNLKNLAEFSKFV